VFSINQLNEENERNVKKEAFKTIKSKFILKIKFRTLNVNVRKNKMEIVPTNTTALRDEWYVNSAFLLEI